MGAGHALCPRGTQSIREDVPGTQGMRSCLGKLSARRTSVSRPGEQSRRSLFLTSRGHTRSGSPEEISWRGTRVCKGGKNQTSPLRPGGTAHVDPKCAGAGTFPRAVRMARPFGSLTLSLRHCGWGARQRFELLQSIISANHDKAIARADH